MKSDLRQPVLSGGLSRSPSWLIGVTASLLLAGACSPPVPRLTGAAKDFADAKDQFGKARYDRALEFTDGFVAGEPGDFNDRGRVLRTIMISGDVNAYKELAEAYDKGADTTKNQQWKAEFVRLRHDNLQYAAKRSLELGEVAHALTQGGSLPKQPVLEAPYPRIEGPMTLPVLNRVREGGWIEPGDQENAALEARRMEIENVLADAVRGDRFKARNKMNAGPVQLDGVDFGLFLGDELLTGAAVFDKKHLHDPEKLRALCAEADSVVKATAALLKETPNPDQEKRLKKLQDDIKAALKNA